MTTKDLVAFRSIAVQDAQPSSDSYYGGYAVEHWLYSESNLNSLVLVCITAKGGRRRCDSVPSIYPSAA